LIGTVRRRVVTPIVRSLAERIAAEVATKLVDCRQMMGIRNWA
jgi:hypothetical protein